MYKSIATVGTLLLNLGELSVEKPVTSLENLSKPVVENSPNLAKPVVENSSNLSKPVVETSPNLSSPIADSSSNQTEPVNYSGNSLSNRKDNFGDCLDQDSNNGSPLSDTGSAQRRLCEALADAAADCSPGSDEGNTNDDEFIRVGSEDSLLSSPEVIDLEDDSRCNIEVSPKRLLSENYDQTTSGSDLVTKVSDHSTKDSENVTENEINHENQKEIVADSSECAGNKDVCEGEQTTRKRSSGNVDPYWCITFEQFLASVLTEPLLVEYFEEQTNIEEIINTVKTEGVRDFVRDPRRSLSVE
jgi:hypothetical protein